MSRLVEKLVPESGSQVPFRVRKKRMENQDRGRMRLNVFRSSKHIYAQVIDDDAGRTARKVGRSRISATARGTFDACLSPGAVRHKG